MPFILWSIFHVAWIIVFGLLLLIDFASFIKIELNIKFKYEHVRGITLLLKMSPNVLINNISTISATFSTYLVSRKHDSRMNN